MTNATEEFHILGDVGSPAFPPWITRHFARLGLHGEVVSQSAHRVDLALSGPEALLDAMALACSLGPREVWVESIERRPARA
jgi:acylphosphatase